MNWTVIAVGNRQIHQVNGITTMDLTDNHPEAKRKGILALQLHAGAPMTVEFKDVQLKRLNGPAGKAVINAVSAKTVADGDSIDRAMADGFQVELLYSVPAVVAFMGQHV